MVKLHWIACGCLNESCKTTGEAVPDHFVDVTKTIRIAFSLPTDHQKLIYLLLIEKEFK